MPLKSNTLFYHKSVVKAAICFCLCLFTHSVWAAPTLNSADLALISYNTDDDDDFALIALNDIPGSSVIFITDEGWDDNDFTFDGIEDCFQWTVSESGIVGGTIIRFTNASGSTLALINTNHGSISQVDGSGDMSLSTGDQIHIYQTADDTFLGEIQRLDGQGAVENGLIYSFNGDESVGSNSYGWLGTGMSHSSSTSQAPDNMTKLNSNDGTGNANIANANGMITKGILKSGGSGELDNYIYAGPTTDATKENWLIRIHNTRNWRGDNSSSFDLYAESLASDWVVLPPNVDPVILPYEHAINYTEDSTPVQILPSATINDENGDEDWNGGTLSIQITSNSESDDEIAIQDNWVGTIHTLGSDLLNDETIIGTLNLDEGIALADAELIITFNANASNALVQQTLQSITFRNTSQNPTEVIRTINIIATDKSGGKAYSNIEASLTAADNDAPYLLTNNILLVTKGGSATISADTDLAAADFDDDNASIVFTIDSEPLYGHIENINNIGVAITSFTQQNMMDGLIQYVQDGSHEELDGFSFTISDDNGNELSGLNFAINIDVTTFENQISENSMHIFPNKVAHDLQVYFNTQSAQANIYTINGTLIKSLELDNSPASINCSDLTNGAYIIQVKSGTNTYSYKFIKQ